MSVVLITGCSSGFGRAAALAFAALGLAIGALAREVRAASLMAFMIALPLAFLALVPSWLRVAVEFRHPSWHREETFALLERHGAAYCVMSGAGLPCVLRATAHFIYIRLHGPDRHHLYAGSYPDADLHWWAARIGDWRAQGRAVFAYFNNDGGGNAVRDAIRLRALLA